MNAPETPPPHTPPPLPEGLTRRRAVGTALAAWASTVLVIAGLDKVAPLSGFVMENLQVIAAALFLYLPTWLLTRQGCDQDAYGLHGRSPLRQIAVALAVGAVVFPLFTLGFHGWQRLAIDRNLLIDKEILVRWPVELEGRPELPSRRPFAVWDERGTITVIWREASDSAPVDVEVALDAPPESVQEAFLSKGALHTRALLARGPIARRPSDEATVVVRGVAPGGVRVVAHGASEARISLRSAGEAAPADAVALGRYALTPGDPPPLHVERGWLWLLTFLLVQVLVVGLPEEVFYRGFLQPRLQLVLPPRLRLLGAPFGWATVVTSVLFALGHYLVDFAPGRLAVFFPSLLFGWIRNRTGSVAAGAVFHGLSNVALALLNRAYVG